MKKVASMLGLYGVMLKKEKEQVEELLKNLDKTDPRERTFNLWDKKFKELTPVLYKYDEALEFINKFGHIEETYFLNLTDEDAKNIAFQRKICSVRKGFLPGEYYAEYSNLLVRFLKRWDLDEVVKAELQNDAQKQDIIRLYNLFSYEKGRKLL